MTAYRKRRNLQILGLDVKVLDGCAPAVHLISVKHDRYFLPAPKYLLLLVL